MSNRPLLLGHRGARATRSVPENSIESFDLALAHGCDGFEFDVRSTRDGVAVLCHDPKFGKLKIATAVRTDLPRLALLEEVLARYPHRVFLDIEIKTAGLEEIVLAALKRYPPQGGLVVSSFFPKILLTFHSFNRALPLGLIADRPGRLARWKKLPIQWVIPNLRLTTKRLIEEAHAERKEICVWTVNSANGMRQLANWGADAIISDDTELLARTLAKT